MRLAPILSLLLATVPAAAAGARPLVLELFTSQGCSSCPPADALLTQLAPSRADLLPLAFHVTYWNSLGWTDPFSFPAATDRQRDYAARLPGGGVFTPQLVIDGRVSLVGSDRASVLAAIASASPPSVGLRVERRPGGLALSVPAGSGRGTIWLVGYDRLRRTAVGRGENDGRTLEESDIVREFRPVSEWSGRPLSLAVGLPAGERAAVLLQSPSGEMLDAAVLLP